MSASIRVTLRSYETVSDSLPQDRPLDGITGKPMVVELGPGTSVAGIFTKLPWLGPRDDTMLVFVNDQQEGLDYELRSGDILDLIAPIAGG
jgi:molybdopterin converting factor small subunit